MDIGGFDLNLLKAFDALYAERHVTRAGTRVGLSQSAMSGCLTRLRELLEDELFVRTPAGMQPTPRAQDLSGPISDALRLLRVALQADAFDPAAADFTVTIAMTDYAAFVLLPPLMTRLSVQAPLVDVRVSGIFGRDEAISRLDSGEANLAIGFPAEASARILLQSLFREQSFRAGPTGGAQPAAIFWLRRSLSRGPILWQRSQSASLKSFWRPAPASICTSHRLSSPLGLFR